MFRLSVALAAGLAWCQSPNGTISGTVSDAQGSRIPNVEVVARQASTGIAFAARSSADGTYVIPAVPVGPVDISAAAPAATRVAAHLVGSGRASFAAPSKV